MPISKRKKPKRGLSARAQAAFERGSAIIRDAPTVENPEGGPAFKRQRLTSEALDLESRVNAMPERERREFLARYHVTLQEWPDILAAQKRFRDGMIELEKRGRLSRAIESLTDDMDEDMIGKTREERDKILEEAGTSRARFDAVRAETRVKLDKPKSSRRRKRRPKRASHAALGGRSAAESLLARDRGSGRRPGARGRSDRGVD